MDIEAALTAAFVRVQAGRGRPGGEALAPAGTDSQILLAYFSPLIREHHLLAIIDGVSRVTNAKQAVEVLRGRKIVIGNDCNHASFFRHSSLLGRVEEINPKYLIWRETEGYLASMPHKPAL